VELTLEPLYVLLHAVHSLFIALYLVAQALIGCLLLPSIYVYVVFYKLNLKA
jgi:hypothetical protein